MKLPLNCFLIKSNPYIYGKLQVILLALITMPVFAQKPVLNNPVVEKVAEGFSFTEGPLWLNETGLIFSDIPENKIMLYSIDSSVSEYLNPSGNSNGLTLDHKGWVIMAQHGPRQVARLEADGKITPLATHYDGKRFNSPNDLVVKSDGSIFFTDPPYGLNDQGGTSELGYYGIYRLSPEGVVFLLDKTLTRPNGICFSPDETVLYVDDCEALNIYAWDVENDSVIANKRLFASLTPNSANDRYADGMKIDRNGFLYISGPKGIWILSPNGDFVNTISVPGQTANCGWGDEDGLSLYVTSGNAIYRIRNGR